MNLTGGEHGKVVIMNSGCFLDVFHCSVHHNKVGFAMSLKGEEKKKKDTVQYITMIYIILIFFFIYTLIYIFA